MEVFLVIATAFVILFSFLIARNNYYFKWIIIKCYLKLLYHPENWMVKHNLNSLLPGELGILPRANEVKLEQPQTNILQTAEGLDSMYFSGVDGKGNSLVCRIVRRPDRHNEVWLLLNVKGIGQFLLPQHPDTNVYNTDGLSFSNNGLKFEVLEPMRKWKISFNGLLRKLLTGERIQIERILRVKFVFIWTAFSLPFSYNCELSKCLLANFRAQGPWSDILKTNIKKVIGDHYEQWGQLYGTINFGNEEEIFCFRGLRNHSFGLFDWQTISQMTDIQVCFQDGTCIHLGKIDFLNGSTTLSHGWMFRPTGENVKIDYIKLNAIKKPETSFEKQIMHFQAGGKTFCLNVLFINSKVEFYNDEQWCNKMILHCANFTFEEKQGQGFVKIYTRIYPEIKIPSRTSVPHLFPSVKNDFDHPLVVNLNHECCCQINAVGGKAASLALLNTSINKQFIVPRTICITNAAYLAHLLEYPHIQVFIEQLTSVVRKKAEGNIQSLCSCIVDALKETSLNPLLQNAIREMMEEIYQFDCKKIKFAIRSSAIGEDGEEISVAGQHETYLGVYSFSEVCFAVLKCWASQFSCQAVEYKRQNGLSVNPGMGVIIQEMIAPDVAGVLFTNNPVTGNPSEMLITANYGLAESVVSGVTEPDTITLSRTYDDVLCVAEKKLGQKEVQIIMNESGGTKQVEVSKLKTNEICLSDEMSLSLGYLSVDIEYGFGSPRDIEWAIKETQIFLLQSRPITSDNFTSFELTHELDSAMKTDSERSTKANTGEVFTNASSPLTISTVVKAVDLSVQMNMKARFQRYHIYNPFNLTTEVTACNHVLLNCLDVLYRNQSGQQKNVNFIIELCLLGHVLNDTEMYKLSLERYRSFSTSKFRSIMAIMKDLIMSKRRLKQMMKVKENFHNQYQDLLKKLKFNRDSNPNEFYHGISLLLPLVVKCSEYHTNVTSSSMFWNLVAVLILTENKTEWTEDMYSDIASLLASCSNVESAEVPIRIKALALQIISEDTKKTFADELNEPQLAVKWLNEHPGEIGKLFRDFVSKHGHRSLKEFDLLSPSWKSKPEDLVTILKNMVKNSNHIHAEKDLVTVADTLLNLKAQQSYISRKILFWILPYYRSAVGYREESKSILIKVIDCLRDAYSKLSQLMVNEGIVPENDLIYFLTHYEIGQLISKRSPKLLKKAIAKRKIQGQLEKLRFPEIIVGMPQALPETPSEVLLSTLPELKIKGTPVCNGKATGIARVVLTLEETNKIQANDILITYCTDIGWSPYFPILSGVVTEIGGILSHGAVVAREYGLPCIVGAQNAAKYFKSGDLVCLDGSKGTLELVKR